jgi:hypothetical protein
MPTLLEIALLLLFATTLVAATWAVVAHLLDQLRGGRSV